MKRFQECNKIGKIWRYRWYLTLPFIFIYNYLSGLRIYRDEEINGKWFHTEKYDNACVKLVWELAIGDAQIKMKWYYTSDEVFNQIKDKRK